ncbi:MAG: hypothetical protein JSU07_03850 [Bacteroidetes bacterium]|nr:hypothetical protein [Bacteroidota bacterium]
MAELHIVDIKYIELNDQSDLEFKYKPEVPKLKLVGIMFNAEDEDEDETEGVLFLTQKQLNQVLANKEIDLKVQEDRWLLNKPLSKEQSKKVGLVGIDAEFMGNAGEHNFYEAVKIN